MNRCIGIASLLILLLIPAAFCQEDTSKDAEVSTSGTQQSFPFSDIFSTSKAKVEAQADSLEYDRNTKKMVATKNVTITYKNTILTSDYAEIETESKKAYARGHVIIFEDGQAMAKGEEIHYDFENKSGSFPDGRSVNPPWFSNGQQIDQVHDGVKLVHHGSITTCDRQEPHYQIKAKKVTIYDKDKMIARNVAFYVLGKPVFWWPYLVIPLQHDNLPFAVLVGYNSRHGAFLSVLKGFSLTKNIYGKFRLDWRSKRGIGGGGDISYDFKRLGLGIVNLYVAQDRKAPIVGEENPFKQNEERTRGRVTWRHRTDFDPNTFLMLRYNHLSDEYVLQDFFEREYRSEIEPNSFVSLTRNTDHVALLAHAEKKMNNFERTVERLPQLQFDWKTQPLLKPWLFYQNQLSFNNMTKRYGRTDINEDVVRSDFLNEWSAPTQWHQFKFTPHLTLRPTYYSRNLESDDDQFRLYRELGADFRTHFYRTFQAHFDKLGMEINDLRHVLEPYTKYKWGVSTVSDEKLSYFDSTDRLDDSNVVTFGVENRIQTKRTVQGRMQRVDLVSMNTFLSYESYPDGRAVENLFSPYITRYTKSDFGILGQELTLRPYEWLQFQFRGDYDTRAEDFKMLTQDVVLRPGQKWKFVLGHRYVKDIPEFADSNQFVFDTSYTINDKWGLNGYVRWDPKADDLQEWQFGARRDLHDFILNFGYNVRNSQIESNNRTLYFELYMKAFPNLGIHGGGGRASFEAPRIGDTVAGSNQSEFIAPSNVR